MLQQELPSRTSHHVGLVRHVHQVVTLDGGVRISAHFSWRRRGVLLFVITVGIVVAQVEIVIEDQAVGENHKVNFVTLGRACQRHPGYDSAVDDEYGGEDNHRQTDSSGSCILRSEEQQLSHSAEQKDDVNQREEVEDAPLLAVAQRRHHEGQKRNEQV